MGGVFGSRFFTGGRKNAAPAVCTGYDLDTQNGYAMV